MWMSLIPAALFVLWLAPFFPFLYVIVRWRSAGASEPGIGSYGLVLFFACGAVLVGASAIAMLIFGGMSDAAEDEMKRAMWGLLGAASTFLVLQVAIGRAVAPAEQAEAATRVFGGFLMAVAGFVVFASLATFFVAWTMDLDEMRDRAIEARSDTMKASGSFLGVFGAVYGMTVASMRS